jgi:hypothetical protein
MISSSRFLAKSVARRANGKSDLLTLSFNNSASLQQMEHSMGREAAKNVAAASGSSSAHLQRVVYPMAAAQKMVAKPSGGMDFDVMLQNFVKKAEQQQQRRQLQQQQPREGLRMSMRKA